MKLCQKDFSVSKHYKHCKHCQQEGIFQEVIFNIECCRAGHSN